MSYDWLSLGAYVGLESADILAVYVVSHAGMDTTGETRAPTTENTHLLRASSD